MKKLLSILFILILSSVYSCSSDEFETLYIKESAKVTAVLADWNLENATSRTSITTGSYPTPPSPVWVEGDSVGIYPDDKGDQLSFRINEGGSKTCTFDGGGWAMKSSSYTAYSPFNRSYYYKEKDALPISMLGQVQNGNDNADHLGAYDIQIAKGEKPEVGSLLFQFERHVALARIEITAPRAATWTSVTLESDASFTTEAKMNLALETTSVTPTTTSKSVTLNLENVSTTSDNLSIIAYMMLLPVDLTNKTLTVTLTDSEGFTYSSNATVAGDKMNFAANSARWINVTYKKEESIPNNQIWYTSSDNNHIAFNTIGFGANYIIDYYEDGKFVIIFDSDISSIGSSAFANCTSLTSITFPRSVTEIGRYAFSNCSSLTSIEMPNSVTTIGEGAFSNCSSLTNIEIPNSVTTIGEGAFKSCSSLTSIEIPNSVTTINRYTFEDCSSLINIKIPSSVTKILVPVFSGCSSLTSIIVEEGNANYDSRDNCNAIIDKNNCLVAACFSTVIPNSVTCIGSHAFYNCTGLTNITIPNKVTCIGSYAFYNCTGLTNITIPNKVTCIGSYAFVNCTGLTNITIPNSVTCIESYAFTHCTSLVRVNVNATTPPETGDAIFYDCKKIEIYVPYRSQSVYKVADGWKEYNIFPMPIGNITEPTKVKKGDYALLDGSFISKEDLHLITTEEENKIAGIVFWIEDEESKATLSSDVIMNTDFPQCKHGLIVALKDVISSRIVWQGTENLYESVSDVFQAKNDIYNPEKSDYLTIKTGVGTTKISGYNNTKVIKAYNTYCHDNNRLDYIVKPVEALIEFEKENPAPSNSTGWYIPSLRELHMLSNEDSNSVWGNSGVTTRDLVNSLISKITGNKLDTYYNYFSSSECNDNPATGAFTISFYNGEAKYSKKYEESYVRAICAF